MLMGAGRMADVAEAGGPGPQTHHQKRRGLAKREGEEEAQRLATQRPAGRTLGAGGLGLAKAPAGPVDGRRGPGAMLRAPAWLGCSEGPGVQAAGLAPGIEAALFHAVSAEEQAAAGTLTVSLGVRPAPPPQQLPGARALGAHPILSPLGLVQSWPGV